MTGGTSLGIDSLYIDNGTIGFYIRSEINATQIIARIYYSSNISLNLRVVIEYTKTTD